LPPPAIIERHQHPLHDQRHDDNARGEAGGGHIDAMIEHNARRNVIRDHHCARSESGREKVPKLRARGLAALR